VLKAMRNGFMGSKLTHIAAIRSNQFCDWFDERHPDFRCVATLRPFQKSLTCRMFIWIFLNIHE
jgi:hypothetical protein